MSKNVWRDDIERDAWTEKHCRVCFAPDEAAHRVLGTGAGCPHLVRASANKLPTVWKRRRDPVLGDTYTCSDFLARPPVNRRASRPADTAEMFDVAPDDYRLVPVDGWKDFHADARKQKDGDHQ